MKIQKKNDRLVQTERTATHVNDLEHAKTDILNVDFSKITVTKENHDQVIRLINKQNAKRRLLAFIDDKKRRLPIIASVIAVKPLSEVAIKEHTETRMMSTTIRELFCVGAKQKEEFLSRRRERMSSKFPESVVARKMERLAACVITNGKELAAHLADLREKYSDHPEIVDFKATRSTLAKIL